MNTIPSAIPGNFWAGFEKQAGVASLVGTVTGAKDMRRGYKLIDKLVRRSEVLQSGATTNARAAARKALAGKAMAGGAGRLAATGGLLAYMTRKRDGGQAQGY